MNNAIIEAHDVCFQYEGSDSLAVDHVSLKVQKGEFLAILGRNGSGKSTFAKLLNALLLPTEGKLTVNGISPVTEDDCYEVRRSCGMVFQNPDNQIVTTIVEEDCAFGLENLGTPPDEIRSRVDDALNSVGMSEYALASPSMLSGGQKQRIAVAGVLVMRPKIIVFDESTAMLDPIGRRDVFALARRLNVEEGITVVWITHFMEEAALADRLAVMDRGRVVLEGTPRDVFSRTERVFDLGLDVPEMMKLASMLRRRGVSLPEGIMTVSEMAVELCGKQMRRCQSQARPARANPVDSDAALSTAAMPNPDSENQDNDHRERRCVIEVKKLTHIYMPGTPFEARALSEISLSVADGEFVGIIGHTGSGKSTLIMHLNGLERSEPGVVFVDGIDLGQKDTDLIAVRRVVGLVFQYPEYQLFEETVAKDVAFGPRNLGLEEDEIARRVDRALKQVGLDPEQVREKSPFELSGGQKRRVAIAGVLAMQPSILILDEPAAGLDPVGRREMLGMIREIHENGVTVVMVSHSMDDVGRCCDRLFVLNRGKLACSGTPAEVFVHESRLHDISLDVPESAKLAHRLRDAGFDMPRDIYHMEDVCEAIIRNLSKGREAEC